MELVTILDTNLKQFIADNDLLEDQLEMQATDPVWVIQICNFYFNLPQNYLKGA